MSSRSCLAYDSPPQRSARRPGGVSAPPSLASRAPATFCPHGPWLGGVAMHARRLHAEAGAATFVLVFDTSDEAMAGLRAFAREHGSSAAHFSGIGAFSD